MRSTFRVLAALAMLLLSAPSALGVQRALAPTRGELAGWLAALGIELAYLSLAFIEFDDHQRQRNANRVAKTAVATAIILNVLADYAARVPAGLASAEAFLATFDWLLLMLSVLESAPLAGLAYTLAVLLHTRSSAQHSAADAQHSAQHIAADAQHTAQHSAVDAQQMLSSAQHSAQYAAAYSAASAADAQQTRSSIQHDAADAGQRLRSSAQYSTTAVAQQMLSTAQHSAQYAADAAEHPAASTQRSADAGQHLLSSAQRYAAHSVADAQHNAAGTAQHPAADTQHSAQYTQHSTEHPTASAVDAVASMQRMLSTAQHSAAYTCPRCNAALSQQQYAAARRYGYCARCKGR